MLVLASVVGAGAGGVTVVARREGAELEMERKAWEGEGEGWIVSSAFFASGGGGRGGTVKV